MGVAYGWRTITLAIRRSAQLIGSRPITRGFPTAIDRGKNPAAQFPDCRKLDPVILCRRFLIRFDSSTSRMASNPRVSFTGLASTFPDSASGLLPSMQPDGSDVRQILLGL